ncbi:TonB-dependent receptor domain-containing protein [Sinimarinibacterium sp. CAU 1509]|uniref:TonB-dependent receptor domain-containing protein n=1 Tax=Sinimarinibacterium sp. CAU 1509 TaxID=2562283 RepID=UPI00146AF758|nr:TonB-dependent receptor [Sinimarinibacterium sp. CAU 1509]
MILNIRIRAALAATLSAACHSAYADSVEQLSPITVTATRTPVAEPDAWASTTVLNRADIERAQATDLAELLRDVTGVDIARNGGPGQVTSVFLRGGESNHTLVLIDGVRVNPATAGGAAVQNLSPELIERIEIVKGPRATLYGSDAIAGVINIITRTPQRSGVGASLRAGALDTREASGYASLAGDTSGINLQAQSTHSDGLPPCSFGGPDRGYDRNSLTLGARGSAIGIDFDARIYHTEGNVEYVDYCDADFGNNPLDQDFRNQVVQVGASARPLSGWTSQLSLSRMVDDIEQQQQNYLGAYDFVRTERPSLDWHNVVELGSMQRFSGGLMLARESVDALSYGIRIEEDRDLWSAYLQDEISLGAQHVLLAASYADHDAFGSEITWNAEYRWDISAQTQVQASAGTGFRAPDATDRFGFGGNPDLDPEQATNFELALHQLIGTAQSLRLSLFQSDVDDLIAVVFDPAAPADDPSFGFHAVNIDRYRNRGAEIDYALNLDSVSLRVGGIWQKPEDRSTGEALLRRAERSAHADLVLPLGPHEIGLQLLAVGDRPDVDASSGNDVSRGGYALLNLNGRLQFSSAWSVLARIENALDKDYQTAAGFNQPGTGAYLTLRYSN